MSTATDREYIRAEIKRMAEGLGLPQSTVDLAHQVFSQAQKQGYTNRDADKVATACLFAACRLQGAGVTVDELAAVSREGEQSIRTHYRTLSRQLGLAIEPNDAEPFFKRNANKLGFPEESIQRGVRLIQQAKDEGLDATMAPHSLAVCVAYLVILTDELGYTQRDLDRVTGVSEVTIRNHWREVAETLQVDIPTRKGMNISTADVDRPETLEAAIAVVAEQLTPENREPMDVLLDILAADPDISLEANEVLDHRHPAGVVGGAFYVAIADRLEDGEDVPRHSQQDVADALGMSLATVQNRIAEFRDLLAESEAGGDSDDDGDGDGEIEADGGSEVRTDGGRVSDPREKKSVVCPECGEQGFDGRGIVYVKGTRMYLRGCWNCGTEFAVEDDDPESGLESESEIEDAPQD